MQGSSSPCKEGYHSPRLFSTGRLYWLAWDCEGSARSLCSLASVFLGIDDSMLWNEGNSPRDRCNDWQTGLHVGDLYLTHSSSQAESKNQSLSRADSRSSLAVATSWPGHLVGASEDLPRDGNAPKSSRMRYSSWF